jgi:hypothetical protein
MRKLKRREQRIREALKELDKAVNMKEPHIRIHIPWGINNDMRGKIFIGQIRDFIEAYKKYYRLEKANIELFL